MLCPELPSASRATNLQHHHNDHMSTKKKLSVHQTSSTWHRQQLRRLISLCLRHPPEFHRMLSGGIPSDTSVRLVSAEVPGRSSSHLSVCRERDEDTVTSSTLQEPSSGATMSEARGPRSGPAHMQTQRHQRSRCVRATALHIISPAPLGAA